MEYDKLLQLHIYEKRTEVITLTKAQRIDDDSIYGPTLKHGQSPATSATNQTMKRCDTQQGSNARHMSTKVGTVVQRNDKDPIDDSKLQHRDHTNSDSSDIKKSTRNIDSDSVIQSTITSNSKDHSDAIISNTYCHICQFDFKSENNREFHMLSKKHRKKLNVTSEIDCLRIKLAQSEARYNAMKREVSYLRPNADPERLQHCEDQRKIRTLERKLFKLRGKVTKLKSTNQELRERESELLLLVDQLKKKDKTDGNSNSTDEESKSAADSIRDDALNKLSANWNVIEWAKDDSVHFTERSEKVNGYRLDILKQQKYASLLEDEYLIENNPLNDGGEIKHTQHSDAELQKIKEFVIENEGAGNVRPRICISKRWSRYEPVERVLAVQEIPASKCAHLKNPDALRGQKECVAKINIRNGTILGQYVGREMLRRECIAVYKETVREESKGQSYMLTDTLQLPEGKVIEIVIDGNGGGDSSPFLYINDGRANIGGEETKEDKERMNVEFVIVLCNGWPMILIRSCKAIKAGDSLCIKYGQRFGLPLDEMERTNCDRRDSDSNCGNALSHSDVETERTLEIISDPDYVNLLVQPLLMKYGECYGSNDQNRKRSLELNGSIVSNEERTAKKQKM